MASKGLFDKIKNMVGGDDLSYDDNYDDGLYEDDQSQQGQEEVSAQPQDNTVDYGYEQPQPKASQNRNYQQNPSYQQSGYQQSSYQQSAQNSAANLEVKVVNQLAFDSSVNIISDHLVNNRTVVLNLEKANKESAHRVLDYCCGVIYTIRGHMRKVANNTFVLTPSNVDVSDQQTEIQRTTQDNFFNGNEE